MPCLSGTARECAIRTARFPPLVMSPTIARPKRNCQWHSSITLPVRQDSGGTRITGLRAGGFLLIAVEAHADVAQEQPAARGDADPVRRNRDQPVVGERAQIGQCVSEIIGKGNVPFLAEGRKVAVSFFF